ncbi:MAG: hypothetical protein R2826_01010 [Thermoleophilia bacterium]
MALRPRAPFSSCQEKSASRIVAEASTIEYNEGGNIVWSFTTLADEHTDKVTGAVADFSGFSGCANRSRFNTIYFI